MKTAKAITKYIRISPKKARVVAGLIKGKKVEDALNQLANITSKGSRELRKTLHSAAANAELKFEVSKNQLIVQNVMIDGGPSLKRGKSRAKGGVVPILKRTSHFTVEVAVE